MEVSQMTKPVPNLYTQTVEQRERKERENTVKLLNGATVKQSDASSSTKKTSFYLTPAQLQKLDDLAHDFNKENGGVRRVDRQDIVRFLVERVELADLLAGL
jgi:uncharacterized secreted protein with C-terminal beta-propeller domain